MKRLPVVSAVACAALLTGGCRRLYFDGVPRRTLIAARNAHVRGDHASAIERAGRALASPSSRQLDADAYYIRGLARERAGDVGGAKADWLSCIGSEGSDEARAHAMLALGDMCYTAGDAEGAERRYRQCIKQAGAAGSPGAQARVRLAGVLRQKGGRPRAPAASRRAGELSARTARASPPRDRKAAAVWTVQAGAFSQQNNAETFTRDLARRQLAAMCRPTLRGDRQVYVVTVGRYRTYGLAQAALQDVKEVENTAFISVVR